MTPEREAELREWTGFSVELAEVFAALDAERELVKRAVPMVEDHYRRWYGYSIPEGHLSERWLQDVRERRHHDTGT